VSIAEAFADIALGMSAAIGGGFHDALAKWPGTPITDDGGSITTPGTPITKTCSAQVDAVTEAMRQADSYTDQDIRILVLAATLDGELDTDATIDIQDGPHIGEWMIASCDQDPCGVYWECRGRRLNVPGVDS